MEPPLPLTTSINEKASVTRKGTIAGSTLAALRLPAVHAQGSDQIRIALIGCGGRGGGAAKNALSVNKGGAKLVAMADVFFVPRI